MTLSQQLLMYRSQMIVMYYRDAGLKYNGAKLLANDKTRQFIKAIRNR